MKRCNYLLLLIATFCAAIFSLPTLGHAQISVQTVADFESTNVTGDHGSEYNGETIARWGIYESPSGAWYTNPNHSMTIYPLPYFLADNGGPTTYTRLLWDVASSNYVFWSFNVGGPISQVTTVVITYRGYAIGGSPSYTAQFRFYGDNSVGTSENGNNITGGLTVSDTVTWTTITCTPTLGDDSGGTLMDIWVELSGGSGPEVQGMDVQSVVVNGINVSQIDTTGNTGGWAERDWSGWGHGLIGTKNVGAPYGNVGVFQIWCNDGGSIKRQFVNLPVDQWANVSTLQYLQFDIQADPIPSSGTLKYAVELYSEAGGSGNGYFVQGDTLVPNTWTHQVINIQSANASLYNYSASLAGLGDIWRIEFLVEKNGVSTTALLGFDVDNITFSNSSTTPVPVELSNFEASDSIRIDNSDVASNLIDLPMAVENKQSH